MTRLGGATGEVTVNFLASPGTATENVDYRASGGVLVWLAGDSSSKSFTIPIIDDDDPDPSETVLLSLHNPTGGATLGVPDVAVLTILDDESGEVSPLYEIPTLSRVGLLLVAALLLSAALVVLRSSRASR